MLMESLHEMGMIAVDAMHRKRPQHEANLGRRLDVRNCRSNGLGNAPVDRRR